MGLMRRATTDWQSWASLTFVISMWAAMLAMALGLVGNFGSNVPWYDDWDLIPNLTGFAGVTPAWLWQVHVDHRVLVPKLIMLPLFRFTSDFRSGMVFNIFVLAALSLAFIRIAWVVRGRPAVVDVVFPIMLLHFGHSHNFLWFATVSYLCTVALAGALLVIIARRASVPFPLAVAGAGCAFLLPMCGAHGWVFGPPMALWVGIEGARRWNTSRGQSLVLIALAILVCVPTLGYWVGYQRPLGTPDRPPLIEAYDGFLRVLSMSLGPAGQQLWPTSAAVLTVLIGLAGVALLIQLWRGPAAERPRVIGLGLFLAGAGSLILGIGWGRSGLGDAGFAIGHVTFGVPLLAALFYVGQLYGPRMNALVVSSCLLLPAGHMLFLNSKQGLEDAQVFRQKFMMLEMLLDLGPYEHQVEKHFTWMGNMQWKLGILRHLRVGHFKNLKADPVFLEVPLDLASARVHKIKWNTGIGRTSGADSYLEFPFDADYVAGVRIVYSHVEAAGGNAPHLQIFWRTTEHAFPTAALVDNDYPNRCLVGPETFAVIEAEYPQYWELKPVIADSISGLRIYPDVNPCTFQITEIVLLLLPPEEPQ